ncbi:MAG: serine hydrolase domain-containing protein [Acidimicrobiales bacterium]
MSELKIEVDPGEVGLDAERLARLDRHLGSYVDDTIWRAYSMAKPVTSVAAMMLYEQGAFDLRDPIERFIPAFGDARVYQSGSSADLVTEPATEPIRVWHLLTHTAGLTYGFHYSHPVDAMYRDSGLAQESPPGMDLAACCEVWAGLPLLFQPGSEWNYSVATDVLGRVIEVVTGQALDVFLREAVLRPLGMVDTAFHVGEADAGRLAALYAAEPGTRLAARTDGSRALRPPELISGGGGLLTTAADYHRFTQMLLRGGELDGARVLGSRTVRYMARNHLPGGVDLEAFGRPLFAETSFAGIGFGLGFSVVIDPAASRTLSSAGELAWGGAASTAFWVDPAEEITAVFMTQLVPSGTHPIRSRLRQLVYQSLVD